MMGSGQNVRDPLTGALLRASLADRMKAEVARARRYGEQVSILLLDLDHFKSVNDAFGHVRGDEALRAFARRVKGVLRASDIMFRYGGDEFVAVLPRTTKRQAVALADRLLEAARSAPCSGKPAITLTASVGIACFPEDASSSEALVEKADVRLYEAKRLGRDRSMAEDPPVEKVPSLHESSRLVERDECLEVLSRFLDQLDTKRRGVLVVAGQAGTGRSRFLQEAGRAARVRGYVAVSIDARRSLTGRVHGALAEALRDQQLALPVSASEREFSEALQGLLRRKKSPGIVFTVDRYAELDRETQELLQWLLASPSNEAVACAYVARREDVRRSVSLEAPLVEAVELAPLTRGGTRVWVRHALTWEAPEDFIGWMHMKTHGLPGLLQKVASHMVRRGILIRQPEGWSFDVDFRSVPLEEVVSTEPPAPRHNLPLMLTTFVGRMSELAETKRKLRHARLLTILGPGGIGKTRLALQAAAEVTDEFGDGVFNVPLASVTSVDLIPHAVADAMQFTFHGEGDPKAQLLDFLRTKDVLLVLDNFEHLLEGSPLLTEILGSAGSVRVLVTSRERLRIQGENVIILGGLTVDRSEGDREIEGPSAIQLFTRTARRADPRFEPDEADREAIARTCRALEGMPLAIEMAAAWITTLDCGEIADAVATSLDMVDGRLRDAPVRHRGIRAVFEQSWERLSPQEKDVLARLSVFRSAFRRDAAERVAGAFLPVLSALVDKSFLRRTSTARLESHELLRRCAAEKLLEDESQNLSAHHAHCAYYAEYLRHSEILQTAEERSAALDEIGLEIDNVRTAWGWAIEHGRADCIEACAGALSQFYESRSLLREGYEAFGRAVRALTGYGRSRDGSSPAGTTRAYARVLVGQGMFARHLARFEEARGALREGLGLLQHLDSARDTALALRQLGIVAREVGQYSEAKAYFEQSRAACEGAESSIDMALSLNELGTTAWRLGEYEEAQGFYRQSIETCSEAGDRTGALAPMSNLAGVFFQLGQLEEGRQVLERALETHREVGNRHAIAGCINNLGLLAWRTGDHVKASRLLRESLAVQQEIGHRSGIACTLNNLGVLTWELSEYEEARRYFNEALEVATEAGDRLRAAISHSGLGDVACALGRYAESAERYRRSLRTALDISATPQVLEALVSLAKLFDVWGEGERALELVAVVQQRPAAQKDTRDRAERLQAEIRSGLPAARAQAAIERGRSRKLEDVAAEILELG